MDQQIEAAAEAICGATGSGRMFPWDTLNETERDAWREMARAAIQALGLTELVQELPVPNGQPCTCNRQDGRHYGMGCDYRRTVDWVPHRRLVSPWVVVEHPQDRSETDA